MALDPKQRSVARWPGLREALKDAAFRDNVFDVILAELRAEVRRRRKLENGAQHIENEGRAIADLRRLARDFESAQQRGRLHRATAERGDAIGWRARAEP